MTDRTPGPWVRRVLRWCLPPGPAGDAVLADLDREWLELEQARSWYLRAALGLGAHYLRARFAAALIRRFKPGGLEPMDRMLLDLRHGVRTSAGARASRSSRCSPSRSESARRSASSRS